MKSLIVYSSQTGNTKKLADTIYDALDGEKEIFAINEAPSGDGYDLIAVGFWFQAGKPDPKTLEYLPGIPKGSRLFLFATHGAAADSDHVKNALEHAISLTDEVLIAGSFTCQGVVNPKVLEKVKQKDTPPPWIGDADQAVGHPDEKDLEVLAGQIRNLS